MRSNFFVSCLLVLPAVLALLGTMTPEACAASLSGTVRFEGGHPPVMKPIEMSNGGQCRAYHDEPPASESVVIGENGAMKNVFVRVVGGLPPGKVQGPTRPVVLGQKECIFTPHVIGIQTHQVLRVLNSDFLLHNVHATPKKARAFNISMRVGGDPFEHTFGAPEFPIEVKCDSHQHMRAYIGVVDHPYFFVTGADGAYEISGLPAGTYEIEVWQEFWAAKLGAMRFSVTLEDGESKAYDIVYASGEQAQARIR